MRYIEKKEVLVLPIARNEYGAVLVTLDQDAYIDQGGSPAETYYTATATDSVGNKYKIRWEITLSEEDQAECTDESNMCDWDDYTAIDLESNNKEVVVEIKW